MASSVYRVLQKWGASIGETLGPPIVTDSGLWSVAISKDSMLIACGDVYGTVKRWYALTEGSIGEPMCNHRHYVNTIVFSDNGKPIVTGSDDKTLRLWDAGNGEAIGKQMEHFVKVMELAISIDGNVIVAEDYDNRIVRWNAETGEQISDPIKVAGCARNLKISYDGSIMPSGSPFYAFVKHRETANREPVGERMKWSDGQHVLNEMRRARLCGEQDCDEITRKTRSQLICDSDLSVRTRKSSVTP